MKKILVLKTSLRMNSNSDALADAFIKGAKESGNEVTEFSLKGKKLAFCDGCLACLKTGCCMKKDDAIEIVKIMSDSDVVVFATPVYYYCMSGQMKTLLDRMNPLYDTDYRFRDIYLLATAAEDEDTTMDGTLKGLEGWVECFPKASIKGTVYGKGVDKAGTVLSLPCMEEAYQLGKSIR